MAYEHEELVAAMNPHAATPVARAVLYRLAHAAQAGSDGRVLAFPSPVRIAAETSLSHRSVQRGLAELLRRGQIAQFEGPRPGRRVNTYELIIPVIEATTDSRSQLRRTVVGATTDSRIERSMKDQGKISEPGARSRDENLEAVRLRLKAEDDWFAECRTLHQGRCNGSSFHRLQLQIDASKAAGAAS